MNQRRSSSKKKVVEVGIKKNREKKCNLRYIYTDIQSANSTGNNMKR